MGNSFHIYRRKIHINLRTLLKGAILALLTYTRTEVTANEDGDINIAPADRRNVYYFTSESGSNFTLVVDTTNCQFGDELIFVFKKGSDTDIAMNFPEEKFLLTYCGSPATVLTLVGEDGGEGSNEVGYDSWTLNFFFDGTLFLNTFDLG